MGVCSILTAVEEMHREVWRPLKRQETEILTGWPPHGGSPHSTIGIWLELPAGGSTDAFYWMAAGTTYAEVAKLNLEVQDKTPEKTP